LAQASAATVANSNMPALPDSVCRNARNGACRLRDHGVRPEKGPVGVAGSVRATSSDCRGRDHHRDRNTGIGEPRLRHKQRRAVST
jgi:hypothetical protein